VRRERKPIQYWGSWIDAGTAEAALARFRSAPDVPMELWITANDHSNVQNADPFFPDRKEPVPSLAAQGDAQSDFVRRLVEGRPIARRVNYYVLGTGEFRTTTPRFASSPASDPMPQPQRESWPFTTSSSWPTQTWSACSPESSASSRTPKPDAVAGFVNGSSRLFRGAGAGTRTSRYWTSRRGCARCDSLAVTRAR